MIGGGVALAGLGGEHRQHPDPLRADDDVDDARGTGQQPLPFLLGDAAGHRHHGSRPVSRAISRNSPSRVWSFLGALAHRAGIDDHQVGVAIRFGGS